MSKDMTIPAIKQVIPGDTFLTNLDAKGIEMAYYRYKNTCPKSMRGKTISVLS